MTAADNIHKYFFHCFSEKIRIDVLSESSARQRIHMKHQASFSLKDKSKKISVVCCKFLFGALRVKEFYLILIEASAFKDQRCRKCRKWLTYKCYAYRQILNYLCCIYILWSSMNIV